MSDIVLDGHVSDKFSNGTSSKAVSLTTTQSKGLVVVWVCTEQNPARTVTSISSTHLTFAWRKSATVTISNFVTLEEWTAPYTSALTSESITVNLSGNIDGATIIAAGFSNGSDTIMLDTNAALAAIASSSSNAACEVGGVSSDATAGTIIACWGTTFVNGGGPGTGANPGSGYTTVDHFNDTNAGLNSFIEAEYKAFTGGALSSATVGFSRTLEKFAIIADVLYAPPSEVDISASAALGASMSATLTREIDLTVTAALGIGMVALPSGDGHITGATPALGIAVAVSLTREVDISVAASLGISMAASLPHVGGAKQPVICVIN